MNCAWLSASYFGAGTEVSLGNSAVNAVHTCALQSAFPAAQPDTLSSPGPSRCSFAVTRIFLSGMNNLPCQWPFLSSSRPVSSAVPTNWGVPLLASFFALSVAQTTVPHGPSPQAAILMMLFPPGLRQTPSKGDDAVGAAAWTAS